MYSWIRVVTQISTEIEWFVASETPHPSKNFIRISRQLLEVPAKYAEFRLSHNDKNSQMRMTFKIWW